MEKTYSILELVNLDTLDLPIHIRKSARVRCDKVTASSSLGRARLGPECRVSGSIATKVNVEDQFLVPESTDNIASVVGDQKFGQTPRRSWLWGSGDDIGRDGAWEPVPNLYALAGDLQGDCSGVSVAQIHGRGEKVVYSQVPPVLELQMPELSLTAHPVPWY